MQCLKKTKYRKNNLIVLLQIKNRFNGGKIFPSGLSALAWYLLYIYEYRIEAPRVSYPKLSQNFFSEVSGTSKCFIKMHVKYVLVECFQSVAKEHLFLRGHFLVLKP